MSIDISAIIDERPTNSEEILEGFYAEALIRNNLTLKKLTRGEKKQIVIYLARHGVFNIRYASGYFAHMLDISRATIYNWLKTIT